MKLYVEILIFVIPFGMVMIWWIWNRLITRRAWKQYNPDDDKARRQDGSSGGFEKDKPSLTRPSQSKGRRLFQATSSDSKGKAEPISRKRSRSFRNPFKRRRKE